MSGEPTPEVILGFDGGTLVIDGPGGPKASETLDSAVRDARIGAYRAPACAYRALLEGLTGTGTAYEDHARRYGNLELLNPTFRFEPFPHQKEAFDRWVAARMAGVVVLPTGSGKTYVAQMAIERCSRDTLVVVPTLDLQAQWVSVLENWAGSPVGIVGGGSFDVRPITVITYDSAARHMEHLGNRFGLIVFDECHHLPANVYRSIAELSIAPFRLGLTATPERSDGGEQILDSLVGPQVYRSRVSSLAGDVLSPYKTVRIAVPLAPDEEEEYLEARKVYLSFCREAGVALSSPRGWQDFIEKAARTPRGRAALRSWRVQRNIPMNSRNKFHVLGSLLEQHARDRLILFTHVNALAYRISSEFLIPVITHQTPTRERADILERFACGDYPAVVTSRVLNEGVDVPDANVGIVLSGSGSVREHVQRLGRILRRKEGKEAVLYELVASQTHEESMSRRRRKHEAYGRDHGSH